MRLATRAIWMIMVGLYDYRDKSMVPFLCCRGRKSRFSFPVWWFGFGISPVPLNGRTVALVSSWLVNEKNGESTPRTLVKCADGFCFAQPCHRCCNNLLYAAKSFKIRRCSIGYCHLLRVFVKESKPCSRFILIGIHLDAQIHGNHICVPQETWRSLRPVLIHK